MNSTFTPDPKIQQIAKAYSKDAIDWAKKSFRIKLNWKDTSIEQIESMLVSLYNEMANAKPTDEQIYQFAKMLGSYVGEVYCKNHGGTWGSITLDDQTFPGIQGKNNVLFWPWGRVQNRLKNGPSDNVWHYYKDIISEKT
jgi:hypothetical protein